VPQSTGTATLRLSRRTSNLTEATSTFTKHQKKWKEKKGGFILALNSSHQWRLPPVLESDSLNKG
jgi:hypothetical protein